MADLDDLNTNVVIGNLGRLAQLRQQRELQEKQERERKGVCPCPHCGGGVPQKGVAACMHCGRNLHWHNGYCGTSNEHAQKLAAQAARKAAIEQTLLPLRRDKRVMIDEHSVTVTSSSVIINTIELPLRDVTSVRFVEHAKDMSGLAAFLKWLVWLFALPGLFVALYAIFNPYRVIEEPLAFLFFVGVTAFVIWLGKKAESSMLGPAKYACNIAFDDNSAVIFSNDRDFLERLVKQISSVIVSA
jgi:hypothetical protein